MKLMELLVELPLAGKLEHEEDALLVVKVAMQAKDVGVPALRISPRSFSSRAGRTHAK